MFKKIRKLEKELLLGAFLSVCSLFSSGGCGIPADEIINESQIDENYEASKKAAQYVIGRLKELGYTDIEEGNYMKGDGPATIFKMFFFVKDPTDTLINWYEIHAINPTTGDEQWWEIDYPSDPLLIQLRDEREEAGLPPDIVIVPEDKRNDTGYLDYLIDKYVNN